MTTENRLDLEPGALSPPASLWFGRAIILGTAVAAVVAVAGLLGYVPGLRVLSSVRPDYVPMAPSSAFCFLVLSAVLYVQSRQPRPGRGRGALAAPALLVAVFSLLNFIGTIAGMDLSLEGRLVPEAGRLGNIPIGRMSPATAVAFVLAGLGAFLLLLRSRGSRKRRAFGHLASSLGVVTALAGATVLQAYIYGMPLMYGGETIPMAATSAFAFIFLSLALVASAGPESFPVRLVIGDSTAARLSRAFLPLIMAVILADSVLDRFLPEWFQVNDTLMVAFLVMAAGGGTVWVVVRISRSVGNALDEANLSLRRSREEQRATLFSIGDAVIATDARGRVTLMNAVAEKLTGWKDDEARGRLLAEVFHIVNALTREGCENPVARVLATGRVVGLANHTLLIARDGSESQIADSGAPIRNDKGDTTGVVLVFRDVTEEYRMQEALRKSEERHREIAAMITDYIFELKVDEGGKAELEWASANLSRVTGRGLEEAGTAEQWKDIFHPDDYPAAMRFLARILESGQGGEIESRTLTKSGVQRWVRIYAQPVTDEATGRPGRIIGCVSDITERRGAEEALRQKNLLLNSIFESSPLAVFCLDREARVMMWSPSAEQMFGWTAEEVLGRFNPIVPEEKRPDFVKNFTPVLKGEILLDRPARRRRKDGSWIDLSLSVSPFRDAQGAIVGGIGMLIDITDRKRAEEALRESEEKYRRLVENSLIGVGMAQGNQVVFINPAFVSMFGYESQEELRKIPLLDLVTPGSQPMVKKYMDLRAAGFEGTLDYEYEILRKDGQPRTLHALSSVVMVGGEKYSQNLVTDITDRKRAEAELAESEQRFRELVNASPNSVAVVQDGQFVFANPACLRMLGYEESEFIGLNMMALAEPGELDLIRARMKNVEQNRANEPAEFEAKKKNGDLITVESRTVPITFDHRPGIMMITTDISDRKQIEEERQKSQRLESIGVLAGGIAHDFNNILTGIMGNISLARMEVEGGDDPRGSLAAAEKASDRARDLTRQLLTFARGGAPVKTLASIRELIADTVEFVNRGSKVKCDLALPGDLLPANIDAGQISQVLNNLVINAIQAMPGGGNVLIAAENAAFDEQNPLDLKPGDYIKVTVTDNGPGMSPEILAKIFEPYFTTKAKGSGLGLATCYSIIQRHGGKITAASELDKGSVFTLYLPATGNEAVKSTPTVPAPAKSSGLILVMDDEVDVLDVATKMLTRLGYQVETARHGAEAIEKYRGRWQSGKPYDLVIMDLTIPGGMGGQLAVQELVRITPRVKAIVASGYSDDPVMANFKEYGFVGMVAKPFRFEEIGRALAAVLG